MTVEFAFPTEWWLEISPQLRLPQQQSTDHQPITPYTSAKAEWTAYLNRLCLDAIEQWLQSDRQLTPTREANTRLEQLWEWINGSVLRIGAQRFILIPSEAIDNDQLEVPQEWVDIPNLVGDYYLAIRVRSGAPLQAGQSAAPESAGETVQPQWLQIIGYATHLDLKAQANYCANDRMYRLDADYLTSDLNALWATLQFCPDAPTRSTVPPCAELAKPQVQSLIERLATAALPRLETPFALWGALLEQPTWRDRLYQRRIQLRSTQAAAELNLPTQLSQWFNQQWTNGWQSLQMLRQEQSYQLAMNLRSETDTSSETVQGKVIAWQTQAEAAVLLMVGITQEADERLAIQVQIHPTADDQYVPSGLQLALLSATDTDLQTVQSHHQDNFIQLRRFRCHRGTQFSLKLVLNDETIVESFLV